MNPIRNSLKQDSHLPNKPTNKRQGKTMRLLTEKIEFDVTCISEHQSSRSLLGNYSTQTGAVNSLRARVSSDKQRKGG